MNLMKIVTKIDKLKSDFKKVITVVEGYLLIYVVSTNHNRSTNLQSLIDMP